MVTVFLEFLTFSLEKIKKKKQPKKLNISKFWEGKGPILATGRKKDSFNIHMYIKQTIFHVYIFKAFLKEADFDKLANFYSY